MENILRSLWRSCFADDVTVCIVLFCIHLYLFCKMVQENPGNNRNCDIIHEPHHILKISHFKTLNLLAPLP